MTQKLKPPRVALLPLMIGVSICLHTGILLFLSVTDAGDPAAARKTQERPLSLFNIALLEGAEPPPSARPGPSEPRPAQPEPAPAEAAVIAENYTVTEEAVDGQHSSDIKNALAIPKASGEPAGGDGVQPETVESSGAAGLAGASPGGSGETAGRNMEYIKRNYGYIQRRIRDRLVYPAPARRAGIQGVSEVTFTIHEDGTVSGIVIKKSSGYEVLDDAAIQTIAAAAPFPKPPAPARLAIPIAFRLR
jgi:protein TonB